MTNVRVYTKAMEENTTLRHTVDALTPITDEGRAKLRYAWRSCLEASYSKISEWGNPTF